LCAFAACSLLLAQSPLMFGDTSSARVLALVPFVLAITAISIAGAPATHRPDSRLIFALCAYLAVMTLTVIRGIGVVGGSFKSTNSAIVAALSYALVAWFAYRLVATAQTNDERWSRLTSIALAPAVFVAFSLLALRVHLPFITIPRDTDVAEGTRAVILSALGGPTTRTSLPFTGGTNASGAISAAGFAAAALLALRVRRPSRIITIPAAALCLYATLLSDSRTALAIALGIVVLFVIRPHARRFSSVIVLTLLAPAYLLGLLELGSSLGLTFVSRNGENLSTGDNRNVIWRGAWTTIEHSDLSHIITGYGAYGQVTSGSIFQYLHLFYSSTPIYPTSHDLALQTLLDTGIIGILVVVGLAVAAFSSLSRVAAKAPSPPIQALTAILIVILLNGATEALPSYLFPETLDVTLLIAAAAIALQPLALTEATLTRAAKRPITSSGTQRQFARTPYDPSNSHSLSR
jgi:O-antigen ligase